VVLCRLAPLDAAADGERYLPLREALLDAAARRKGPSDLVVSASFDDVAVIRGVGDGASFHEEAAAFVEGIRAGLDPALRGAVSFGIGAPRPDPFLLVLSHQEAAAAVSALTVEGRSTSLFYDEITEEHATSCSYPLDVEASIMKAVRSANADLLDSLLAAVRRENLVVRRLPAQEAGHLLVELRGTLLRLLNELPQAPRGAKAEMELAVSQDSAEEGFERLAGVFHAMIEAFDRGKRSHNSELLRAIQEYLAANYGRADLGLTVIADAFKISENYLSNFYKEQTGEGLSAALHRIRFDRAAKLLRETEETIDVIALRCGYVNTSSFRRAFRQRYGLSPSAYKAVGTAS
jgi:two-component system, response regulator YesN